MRVQDADVRPSLSTRAATGIARSARPTRAIAGSKRAKQNYCPRATFTWSLRCRGNFRRSHCKFPPRNNHDTIFFITTPARARAPMPQVCLRHGDPASEAAGNPVKKTGCDTRGQSIPLFHSLLRPHRHSKPIARPFHHGFLQVAVSKTLRRSRLAPCPNLISPERFRYSTST